MYSQEKTKNIAENAVDEVVSKGWNPMINKLEGWYDAIIENIPNMIMAVLVFLIVFILSKYISKGILKLLDRTKLQKSIKSLISKAVSVVIIILGLFLVLGILNLSKALNTILAGAGVVGLAVGLALQGALSNTYSGIILSFIKDIKFGDWVETNGIEGEVVDIDLRAVTLKQPDNNLVYIPNKIVVENPIKNFSTTAQSRVILDCGVGYGSDLRFVESLTKKTIAENFDAVSSKNDVVFLFKEFGDSAINYQLRFWIDSTSALQIAQAKSEAIMIIKEVYDKNDINIPFPIRTLDFPKGFEPNSSEGIVSDR